MSWLSFDFQSLLTISRLLTSIASEGEVNVLDFGMANAHVEETAKEFLEFAAE